MKPRTTKSRKLALLSIISTITALAFVLFARATRQEELDLHLLDAVCNRDVNSAENLLDSGANPNVRFVVKAKNGPGWSYQLTVKATHTAVVEELMSVFIKHKAAPQPGEPCIILALSTDIRSFSTSHIMAKKEMI